MNIKFSRHAKRRAKLYKIPEDSIREIVRSLKLKEGKHEIIEKVSGFKFPIKAVVVVENDTMTVITNYPLRKGI